MTIVTTMKNSVPAPSRLPPLWVWVIEAQSEPDLLPHFHHSVPSPSVELRLRSKLRLIARRLLILFVSLLVVTAIVSCVVFTFYGICSLLPTNNSFVDRVDDEVRLAWPWSSKVPFNNTSANVSEVAR